MIKIVEIFSSWVAARNPTPEVLEKAKSRAEICDGCEFKGEIDSDILKTMITEDSLLSLFKCTACGCPLSKKVFTPRALADGACPKFKWVK